MCPIYKLFSLILFTLTATIGLLCADFDSDSPYDHGAVNCGIVSLPF